MDRIDGRPVYSAMDLVAYLACEHLTQLERAAFAGLVERPIRDDPELDIIRKRGFEHEARFLADLRAAGRTAITIELDGSAADRGEELRAAAGRTIEAMAACADVIYQATFFNGTFRGHADFLLRVEAPGRPEPAMPTTVDLQELALARHPLAPAPVARRTAGPDRTDVRLGEDPAEGPLTVAVDQAGRAIGPIVSEQPADLADRQAQDAGRLLGRQSSGQDVVEDVQALLRSGVQGDRLPRLHAIEGDKVTGRLAGDTFTGRSQGATAHRTIHGCGGRSSGTLK